MVLGRFLWFFMGKNLQKLNWHGTDGQWCLPGGGRSEKYQHIYMRVVTGNIIRGCLVHSLHLLTMHELRSGARAQ